MLPPTSEDIEKRIKALRPKWEARILRSFPALLCYWSQQGEELDDLWVETCLRFFRSTAGKRNSSQNEVSLLYCLTLIAHRILIDACRKQRQNPKYSSLELVAEEQGKEPVLDNVPWAAKEADPSLEAQLEWNRCYIWEIAEKDFLEYEPSSILWAEMQQTTLSYILWDGQPLNEAVGALQQWLRTHRVNNLTPEETTSICLALFDKGAIRHFLIKVLMENGCWQNLHLDSTVLVEEIKTVFLKLLDRLGEVAAPYIELSTLWTEDCVKYLALRLYLSGVSRTLICDLISQFTESCAKRTLTAQAVNNWLGYQHKSSLLRRLVRLLMQEACVELMWELLKHIWQNAQEYIEKSLPLCQYALTTDKLLELMESYYFQKNTEPLAEYNDIISQTHKFMIDFITRYLGEQIGQRSQKIGTRTPKEG